MPLEVWRIVRCPVMQKKFKKCLARLLTPCLTLIAMPNQPDPDKAMLALRIPRALKARVVKAAKRHKMTMSEYVVWLLTRETHDIELTEHDYRKIAKEVEEARKASRSNLGLRPPGTEAET